jgi:dipeptidyl aminopeptidase/acylaminoacyl peptidase
VSSLRATLAVATILLCSAAGCGSSAAPENGRIFAWTWSGGLYGMNLDGSGVHRVLGLPRGGAVPLPIGRWIFYDKVIPITDPKVSYVRVELWKMRADGTAKQLVARDAHVDALSPDGGTIAFDEDACIVGGYDQTCEDAAQNPTEIYTIGIDGRDRRRLTHNTWYDGDPSWSPDGKFIAFATETGMRIMRRDGSDVRYLTDADSLSVPDWSPRGDRLLISGFGTRWRVVSTDGDTLNVLAAGPPGPKWEPVWSPDGRQIAYLAKHTRSWSAETPLQIWVMNADGTGRHPITETEGWSIAYWAPA